MTPTTLTALRGSIAKWRAIVDSTGADEGTDNCPLCALFFVTPGAKKFCIGCPVSERTSQDGCFGTPYTAWALLRDEHVGGNLSTTLANFPIDVVDDARDAAREELTFLRALLPPDDPDNPDNDQD